MSEVKVDKISPKTGTSMTVGDSGDTFTVPSGATLTVAGALNVTGTTSLADGTVNVAELDIDGASDIGAGIADADLFVVDDNAAGANRKTAASRLKTYILADNSLDSDMYVDGSIDTAHIGATQVTGAKLNTDIISAQTALAVAPADTDEFMVSDAGVLKRIDYSLIKGINATNFRPNAKPIIINGDMAVNQRGTVTGVATNTYVIDMWTTQGDDCTLTISKDTDVPTGEGFGSSQKLDITSANASLDSGDIQYISTRLEGQDLQLFKKGTASAETWTLAFWTKMTTTGTYIVQLQDDDNTRHCCQTFTISSANTWEHKVLNFPADTTGAFDNDANRSLRIIWILDAASDKTSGTLATTWASQVTANVAAGITTGWTSSTANNFWITGVQLEVGTYTSATLPPFQHESYGNNLHRCERYYQVIAKGVDNAHLFNAYNLDATNTEGTYNYFPQMRAVPSIDQDTGTNYFEFRGNNANSAFNSFGGMDSGAGQHAVRFYSSGGGGSTSAGQGGAYRLGNASAGVAMNAEL